MKKYLNLDGLNHFLNRIVENIGSAYVKNTDYENSVSRIIQNENDISDLNVQNRAISEALGQKVSTSTTINGKNLATNITLSASDVGADEIGSAVSALSDAKSYTDTKISALINSAPTTLDTLGEIAAAMEANDSVVDALEAAIGNKSDANHTHDYAGSTSAGGAAISANKLNTNAGSATQPVYFANGIPVKTTYTLAASVPSDAKFTDTTYSVATQSADGLMSAADKKTLDNLDTYVGDSAVASQIADAIINKSDVGHTHDNQYYTEAEIDSQIGEINASIDGLATVAKTGSWNDLEDKPVFNNITDIEIEQICKSVNAVTVFNDAKLGSTMI